LRRRRLGDLKKTTSPSHARSRSTLLRLRTIALCYRNFRSWPPKGAQPMDDGEVDYDDLATDPTLIGITGIEDPVREGVREAVTKCKNAGVRVTMCTGDNVLSARSIAQQCDIYARGGIIMEGPHFRTLSLPGRPQRYPAVIVVVPFLLSPCQVLEPFMLSQTLKRRLLHFAVQPFSSALTPHVCNHPFSCYAMMA